MPIVTLTTDWGVDGAYSGAFKGKLLQVCPQAVIVDISNAIKPFEKIQAAYVIRSTYKCFPKGTYHIMGVGGNDQNTDNSRIIFEHEGYFFLGLNDGSWGLVFDMLPRKYHKLNGSSMKVFPELDVFTGAIKRSVSGEKLGEIGVEDTALERFLPSRPSVSSNVITGEVIYIDTYGNAITNITRDDFNRIFNGKHFKIYVVSQRYVITKINDSYNETENAELLAIFGFNGYLEIAMANANIRDMLNLHVNSTVRIVFSDVLEVQPETKTPLLGNSLFS